MKEPVTETKTPGFYDELQQTWRRLENKGFFGGLLLAWVALFHFLGNSTFGYFDTPSLFNWMYGVYTQGEREDEHGLLIPLIVVGLFWWKRKTLIALRQEIWWPGLLGLWAAMMLHVFGYVVQQPRASIVALYAGLCALVALAWGRQWFKATWGYFVLFLFCVPMGNLEMTKNVTLPLREFSAAVTTAVAHIGLGLEVVRQGTQIFSPDGTHSYEVNAACSGIRSLISLLVLMSVYGLVFFKNPWKRVAIILFSVPLALFCNILRLIAVILAGEAFGQQAGVVVHDWSGFFTYALAVACMFTISHFWQEPSEDSGNRDVGPVPDSDSNPNGVLPENDDSEK